MDSLKEWAAVICSVSVGSVFTVFLVPEGKIKKQAETVISLVFLLLVVSFVTDIRISDFDKLPDFEKDDIQFDSNAYIAGDVKKYTENFIRAEIQDICTEEFEVLAVVSGSNNVYTVDSVIIRIDKSDLHNIPEIKRKVTDSAGLTPEVIAE